MTTFEEEGNVEEVSVDVQPDKTFSDLEDNQDKLTNDIIGFLKRPIHYADFLWKASEPDAVQLLKIQLPYEWLKTPMIREKLSGFRYVRANLRVRVQINAQPFNAGILIMVFIPAEQQMQATPSSMASFAGLTGYSNVKLDLSSDTAMELEIPYFGVVSHWDMLRGFGYLGAVKLMVYSPLTGLADVDGTVWIHATEVSVALPTGLPLPLLEKRGEAHAGAKVGPKAKGPVKVEDKKAKVVKTKEKVDADKVSSTSEKGTVEKIAKVVGDIAGAAAAVTWEIPVIGEIAAGVAWAGKAVETVASWFGWSKPIDDSVSEKVVPFIGQNFANVVGNVKGKSLAVMADNETEIPTQVFNTDDDEMAFAAILPRWNYLDRFHMKGADLQRTLLWKWPVDPLSCRKLQRNDPAVTPYYPNMYYCENNFVSYIASFFRFWRGTLCYKLRIIKTCFHSGRIRIAVVPGATPKTDVSSIDFNKCHSDIIDIRERTEFEFSVPYKWFTPWKPLDHQFEKPQLGNNITPNVPTAMIYVFVVNALRNPSTCADNIAFIVEQAGGEDLQFAFPMTREGMKLVHTEEQLRQDYPAQPAQRHFGTAHSGDLIDRGKTSFRANTISMGEVVTGWRALLKRNSRTLQTQKYKTGFLAFPYNTTLTGSTLDPPDLYSAAAILYRFQSGTIVISAIQEVFGVPEKQNPEFVSRYSIYSHDQFKVEETNRPWVLQYSPLEPLTELQIPFYQETPAILTDVGLPHVAKADEGDSKWDELPYNSGTSLFCTRDFMPWRITGEDFSFGYLIGAPATLVPHPAKERVKCVDTWRSEGSALNNLLDVVRRQGGILPPPRTNSQKQVTGYYQQMDERIFGRGVVPPSEWTDMVRVTMGNIIEAVATWDQARMKSEFATLQAAAVQGVQSVLQDVCVL